MSTSQKMIVIHIPRFVDTQSVMGCNSLFIYVPPFNLLINLVHRITYEYKFKINEIGLLKLQRKIYRLKRIRDNYCGSMIEIDRACLINKGRRRTKFRGI